MGTQKRERQKANRLQRQLEEARAERVSTVKRSVLRWTAALVAAVAGVVLIAWLGGAFSGDDDGEVEDQSTISTPQISTPDVIDDTTPEASSTPTSTFPVPPKPEVSVPDEVPTELVVTDLTEGTGPAAAAGDTVLVHYVGVLTADGTEFENSYDGGQPFPVTLGVGQVIPGWDEGLIGVKAGGRRQLDIPADLAYGDAGSGELIKPGDALTFVIDVLSVTQGDS